MSLEKIKQKIKEGKPYLEKCVEPVRVGKQLISVDKKIVSLAYFHLALLSLKEEKENPEITENFLNQRVSKRSSICD